MLGTTLSQVAASIFLATQILHGAASSSLGLVGQPHIGTLNVTETSCRGSFWCPKLNIGYNSINIYFQDWINYTMSDSDIYGPNVQIACDTVTIAFPPLGTFAFCASTAGGNVPAAGIKGSLIKQKMEELRNYGCFACGSVAIAESGDPVEKGVFKIDFVSGNKVKCGREGQVVCPPTVPSVNREGLEQGPRPELGTFNATIDDGAITLEALNIQDS